MTTAFFGFKGKSAIIRMDSGPIKEPSPLSVFVTKSLLGKNKKLN